MMYYSVMTQANLEKETSNWKVLGSTPDRSTRNFFIRVACVITE